MEVLTILAFLLLPGTAPASEGLTTATFSQDSALAVLHYLSVDIGPRPMGSPAEQRAMQFAVEEFRRYGCQQAYVMPMASAHGVNTRSGIAIGVLKGATDRIIIIGGHMDSAGPEIPGANDDGSGAACVIELARILSQRPHKSTLMFCCWGGEEHGLEGSKYFVEHFDRIDSVVLMLQIDMADGASILEIDPEYGGVIAPRWLVDAAYDVFYNELGFTGLVYPVASASINAAAGGSTGSDHDAFLAKGIPAIDFTSDVNYPIHTPQDSFDNFTPSGLKKSGDLIAALVERFDAGTPSRATERYMLIQAGSTPLFVPDAVLWGIIAGAGVLGIVTLFILRRKGDADDPSPIRWSALKLVLFTLIIQACIWQSETLLGYIRGIRFPWVNNFGGFVVVGLLCGAIGLWLVLHLVKRLPISKRSFPYAWRSMLYLGISALLGSLLSPHLAVFFALSIICVSFAFLARWNVARVALWSLSALIMLRLVFFEDLGLIQRLLAENKIHSAVGTIFYEVAFIGLFTFLSFPFVFGFAAIYRFTGVDLLWLKKFRGKIGIVGVAGAAILVSVVLLGQPVYGAKWYNNITVEQQYTRRADSSTIEIRGSEYLNGVKVVSAEGEMLLSERTNFYKPRLQGPSTVDWFSVHHSMQSFPDTGNSWVISRVTNMQSLFRPYTIVVKYNSEKPFTLESPVSHGGGLRYGKESGRYKFFAWYSFPDTSISLPVTFRTKHAQEIVETIEVKYDSLAYDLRLFRDLTNVEYRTFVIARDTFSTERAGAGVR